MNNKKIPLVAVVGATASGKTSLGISLAKRLGGEVISCDSMQIYRDFNIGTAKPTLSEMDGVVHHGIDIAEPFEEYSVQKFCEYAHSTISDIYNRGKLPILVGGTGLYIDNIILSTDFSAPVRDDAFTKELYEYAEKNGNDALYEILKKEDPEQAKLLHPNDVRRIIRAIETIRTTGKTRSQLDKESRSVSPYDALYFAIDMERDALYERINKRVDIMLKEGLIDEVISLYPNRKKYKTSLKAIGYREIIYYLKGLCTLFEATELIKRNSRRYAKRQLTWFRRNKEINWLNIQNAASAAEKLIKERFNYEITTD